MFNILHGVYKGAIIFNLFYIFLILEKYIERNIFDLNKEPVPFP